MARIRRGLPAPRWCCWRYRRYPRCRRRPMPRRGPSPWRAGGWSSRSAPAASPIADVLAAMRGGAPPPLRPRGRAAQGLRRPAAAHRRRPDHLAALHRGADDARCSSIQPGDAGAGDRHRLGLPGGGARRAWPARSTRSRSSRPWAGGRGHPGRARLHATSTSASATASRAGRTPPPSTASSSPRRRRASPSR